MAFNLESQKKKTNEFSTINIFMILLFAILISAESLTDKFCIDEEPILELKHSNVKIYKGRIKADNCKVLIKIHNNSSASAGLFLSKEIEIHCKYRPEFASMKTADHESKLFFTTCQDYDDGSVAFIYKYSGQDILKSYILKKNQKNGFMIDEALEILRDTLIELNFFDKHEIHFINLNIENIFINKKGEINFPDLSFVSVENYMLVNTFKCEKLKAVDRSIAPELMKNDAQLTNKVDMYSFGIIMSDMYEFIDFGSESNIKSKLKENYKDLINKCLNEYSSERISLEDALKHPLFQPLLSNIYKFGNLKINADTKSYGVFQMNNELHYRSKTDSTYIKITQLTETSADDHVLHILKPEDVQIEINSHNTSLYWIKRANLDKIQFIFEIVKQKALEREMKPKLEKPPNPENENLSLQKEYLQKLRLKRKKQQSRFKSTTRKISCCF